MLDTYIDSHCLLEIFDWAETRQKYDYWQKIYWTLVDVGYQDTPEKEAKFWDVKLHLDAVPFPSL